MQSINNFNDVIQTNSTSEKFNNEISESFVNSSSQCCKCVAYCSKLRDELRAAQYINNLRILFICFVMGIILSALFQFFTGIYSKIIFKIVPKKSKYFSYENLNEKFLGPEDQ